MRRAMRHSHKLGFDKPILFDLSKLIINLMGDPYNELVRAEKLINLTLHSEEDKFLSTLSRGLKILEEEAKDLYSGDIFDGKTAFKLYDTYGFPIDLTEDLLRDKGLSLDKDQFDISMKKQKDDAKKSWLGSGEKKTDEIWFEVLDVNKKTEFLGYKESELSAQVVSIISNGKLVNKIEEGDEGILIFNQTPFYAESGGQVGDIGIISGNDTEFNVTDTKKKINSFHAHIGILKKGQIQKNDILNLCIDQNHRNKIKLNHSSTHLLHEALRQVLGEHVTQKGSQVTSKKLRFDFSHNTPLEYDDLLKIESIINEQISSNSKVKTEVLSYDKAVEKGALALFGEKYDDSVRVLSMGEDNFSMELCGGTHVDSLSEIGSFKLTAQSSVASGIRRLEAVTGSMVDTSEALIEKILTQKKAKEDKKSNKKSIETISKNVLDGEIIELGKVSLFFDFVKNVDGKNLRVLIDECKKDYNNSIICIISSDDNKVTIAMGVTDDIIDDYDSVELVNIVSEVMKGKGGGGRRDMALAGGTDIDMVDEAKKTLIMKIKNKS
jgi:alanyl-tRNA synthetase